MPAVGTAAACSKVRLAGIRTMFRPLTYSANAPDREPNTRSPTSMWVTLAPIASTSPATSTPRTVVFGRRRPSLRRARYGLPRSMCQS